MQINRDILGPDTYTHTHSKLGPGYQKVNFLPQERIQQNSKAPRLNWDPETWGGEYVGYAKHLATQPIVSDSIMHMSQWSWTMEHGLIEKALIM